MSSETGPLNWIGFVVSIDCGEILGSFQGEVTSVDTQNQTICLKNSYRNGICCTVPEITLSALDIKGLKILRAVSQSCGQTGQTNGYNQNLCQRLPTTSGPVCLSPKQSPKDSQQRQDAFRRRAATISDVRKTATPRRDRHRLQDKDDDCLNTPISRYILENDFDFEKNLALFDKQAVFDEIDACSKVGTPRLADGNRKTNSYRCDENVLDHQRAVYRQIHVPSPGSRQYVTDSGLIVPSITPEFRKLLLYTLEKRGFSTERQLELIGRSAAEMTLQLLGGSHRLNPNNSHQKPSVVVLCGPHFQGAQALNCGRHLSNHGANVTIFMAPCVVVPSLLASELSYFRLTPGKWTTSVSDFSSEAVDIIINGLYNHDEYNSTNIIWHNAIVEWIALCKAPVLAIDPPPADVVIHAKWCLTPALPLSYDDSVGSVFLCDLSIPHQVFHDLGVFYSSPFGSKFVIPLRPNDTK